MSRQRYIITPVQNFGDPQSVWPGIFCYQRLKKYQIGIMHSGGMNVFVAWTWLKKHLGKDILHDLKSFQYRLFNGCNDR